MSTPPLPPASAVLLPPLLASFTLGLAPFAPEPHVLGKLRWVLGGGAGMSLMDWGDFAMHGAPWVWLVVTVARVLLAGRTSAA